MQIINKLIGYVMKGLSGAGGYWQVIDEISDPNVVKQRDSVSCGIACGEMLLRAC